MAENATKRVQQFFQITRLHHFENFLPFAIWRRVLPKKILYWNEFNEDRKHKTIHIPFIMLLRKIMTGPTPLEKFSK